MEQSTSVRGAGGTSGGVLEFVVGLVMASAGGYMLTSRVMVTSSYWSMWGPSTFGLTLVPLLAGVALIFFHGRSRVGWLLVIAGLAVIFAGILMNLHVYFQPTSLYATLLMMALVAGGLGLIARAVRPH